MVNEKKPSIYVDRGTIGSSDELDEYGVWVKSEPQDLSSVGAETQETSDISAEISADISEDIPEEGSSDSFASEDLDLAIPDIEDLPDFDTPLEEETTENFDDLVEKDDFELPDLETTEADDVDLPMELSVELSKDDSFEDTLDAGNDDFEQQGEEGFTEVSMDDFIGTLDSEPAEIEPVEEQSFFDDSDQGSIEPTKDLSTQLLMKIAEELSSIRSELSSLKKDLSNVKAGSIPTEEEEEDFFGKEDDEKIALTGDELNNILNTAHFTEEAGADATMELSEELSVQEAVETEEPAAADDTDFEQLNLDMNMDISLEETELDELEPELPMENIEEMPDFDTAMSEVEETLPDFSIEETDELKQIRENGAEPMTTAPAPEDSEYLTEDSLNTDEAIDLSQAVIDEPDLSSDIQDNPLEEPSLEDISIDLDLSEDAFETESEESEHESSRGGMDFSMEISSSDRGYIDEDIPLSIEPESETAYSVSTEDSLQGSTEDGGDLSLIPEGFVMEASELDSEELEAVELESEELEPEELDSAEFDSTGFDTDESSLEEAELISEELDSEESLSSEDETISVDDIDNFVTGTGDTLEGIGGSNEIQSDQAAADISADISDDISADVSDGTQDSALSAGEPETIPSDLKKELKTVLTYMDQLLESLPDDKIEEFAKSEYYDTYKKLFKELGLV